MVAVGLVDSCDLSQRAVHLALNRRWCIQFEGGDQRREADRDLAQLAILGGAAPYGLAPGHDLLVVRRDCDRRGHEFLLTRNTIRVIPS